MRRLTPARQALEEKWYQRVVDAKGRLDNARAGIRAENVALREYNRVLRIYADLVMDGKVPDEDKAAGA